MKKVLIFTIAVMVTSMVFSSEDSKNESLTVEFEMLVNDVMSYSSGLICATYELVGNASQDFRFGRIDEGMKDTAVALLVIPLSFYGLSSYVACLAAKSTMNNKTLDHDRNLVFNTTQAIISEANF